MRKTSTSHKEVCLLHYKYKPSLIQQWMMTRCGWISHDLGRRLVISVCPNECLHSEITISHKAVSWWIISHKATMLTWPPVLWVHCPAAHSQVISIVDGPVCYSTREWIYFRLMQALAQSIRPVNMSTSSNNSRWATLKASPLKQESTLQPDIPGPKGFFSLKAIWKKWQVPACCVCQFVPPCLTSFVCGN